MRKKASEPGVDEKIGGLALYLSLVALLVMGGSNLCAIIRELFQTELSPAINFLISFPCLVAGYFFARLIFSDANLVFMHEIKHALVSGLAGNQWKKMQVGSRSGHFEYSYSKRTAHLNAMIALAPYFVPLLTIPTLLVAAAAFYKNQQIMIILSAFAYGIDMFSNLRDIDPRQSDFFVLRGGFSIGILYVFLANFFIFTTFYAWIFWGINGLKLIAVGFWENISFILSWVTG